MCMCVASTRLIVCVACCNSSAELIELYGNDMTIIICHSNVTYLLTLRFDFNMRSFPNESAMLSTSRYLSRCTDTQNQSELNGFV